MSETPFPPPSVPETGVSFDTYSEARAVSESIESAQFVYVNGRDNSNDGGQGTFQVIPGGVSEDDDDGMHLVTNGGDLLARITNRHLPQYYGAVHQTSEGPLKDDPDATVALQNWLDFWANPWKYTGWQKRPEYARHNFDSIVPPGWIRCDGNLKIELRERDGAAKRASPYIPGNLHCQGTIWEPNTSTRTGAKIEIKMNRVKATNRFWLKVERELEESGKTRWADWDFPRLYRDPGVYRTWASGTRFYNYEQVKHTLPDGRVWLFTFITSDGDSDVTTNVEPNASETGDITTDGNIIWHADGDIQRADGKIVNQLLQEDYWDCGIHVVSAREIGTDVFKFDAKNFVVGSVYWPNESGAAVGWTKAAYTSRRNKIDFMCVAGDDEDPFPLWCNDHYLTQEGVSLPRQDSRSEQNPICSTYGVVITGEHNPATAPTNPSNIVADAMAPEGDVDDGEAVNFFMYTGVGECRNTRSDFGSDGRSVSFVAVNRLDYERSPKYTKVFSHRHFNSYESNGMMVEAEGRLPRNSFFEVRNQEFVTSGIDYHRFKDGNYAYERFGNPVITDRLPQAGNVRYIAESNSWDMEATRNQCIVLEADGNNGLGDWQLTVQGSVAEIMSGANDGRYDFVLLDEDLKVIDPRTWPIPPFLNTLTSSPLVVSTYACSQPNNTTEPITVGMARYVKRVAVIYRAKKMTGFAVHSHGLNARQIKPSSSINAGLVIDNVPEIGAYAPNTVVQLADGTRWRLSTSYGGAAANAKIYATSGASSTISGPIEGQYGYSGLDLQRYEEGSWQTVLTVAEQGEIIDPAGVGNYANWVQIL